MFKFLVISTVRVNSDGIWKKFFCLIDLLKSFESGYWSLIIIDLKSFVVANSLICSIDNTSASKIKFLIGVVLKATSERRKAELKFVFNLFKVLLGECPNRNIPKLIFATIIDFST